MIHIKYILLAWGFAMACLCYGQRNAIYQQYIDEYSDMAIEQMRRYKIPASITMAQAILESGAGRSYLATKANNHFGIKVSAGWNGGYVRRDDDRKNEKFRKYKNVEESYEDHSKFLLKDRYKRLFDLDPLDYKGWARGLKACGYATLPTYANRLITIIETYELYELDEDRHGLKRKKKKKEVVVAPQPQKHQVIIVNGKPCVIARQGDTWESIAKELKISKRKLLKYNEMSEDFGLPAGMNVFLEKKAKKADAKYKDYWHKVKQGESMYGIAQYYGIRLENLYKMNFKDDSYLPIAGDLLKVR